MEKTKNNENTNSKNTSEQSGVNLDASVSYTDETVSVYNNVINNNPKNIATGFNNSFGGTDPKVSLVNPLAPNSSRGRTVPSQSKIE